MGLDMYLRAEIYLSKYRDWTRAKKVRKLFPEIKEINNMETTEITFEVGYWRKANAIHKWFVDNCQDGKDECQTSHISREQIKQLHDLCVRLAKILKLKNGKIKNIEEAKEQLPTETGFFFGTTDYDENYLNDIKETIKITEYCLGLPEEYSFEYHSSW